jgi:hypothetical protein
MSGWSSRPRRTLRSGHSHVGMSGCSSRPRRTLGSGHSHVAMSGVLEPAASDAGVGAQPRAIVEAVASGQLRIARWAFVGLVSMSACRAAPPGAEPEPYVLRLDARSAGAFDGRGQSAWVADVVTRGLENARWFRAQGEGPELVARLRYEERTTAEGVPVLHAQLVVEPDAALAAELEAAREVLDAHVELERRDQTIDLRRDLPIAVERALALVDTKVTAIRGTTAELEALITNEDPEVILVALDGVERRRLRSLGDAVFSLVEHPEERVALRAVECLGVVGGEEHASGLVRLARLADRAHANRVYEALAKLGGEQARGFLAFAARNEDDPELASLAERALAQLEANEPLDRTEAVARGHRQ